MKVFRVWIDTWDELINLEDIRYTRYVEIKGGDGYAL